MKRTANSSLIKIAGLMLVVSASLANAQVIYFQSFDSNGSIGDGSGDTTTVGSAYNTTTSPTNNELTQGWGVFSGTGAVDGTYIGATGTGPSGSISDRVSPGGVTAGSVNAPSNYTPQATNHTDGFAIENQFTVSPLLVTEQATINPVNFTSLTFNWYQGDATTTDHTRFVIQEGGNWYASTATFANSTAISAASFSTLSSQAAGYYMTLNYSNAATNWDLLTFTPGSALSVGAVATSNLTGPITGFGFLGQGASSSTIQGNVRLDSLSISGAAVAVPEPSTWALMVGGVSMLVLLTRRNRRRQNV